MTPTEQNELDSLKQKLRQTEALFEQEKGKRIAVERDSYEVKRNAKKSEDEAAALVTETQASLAEAAEQMKVCLAVSQGIWAFGQLGRAYMARKTAAARITFREAQSCLLMQQVIDAQGKGDPLAMGVALDKMKALIATVKQDGEQIRLAAIESSLAYGLKGFEKMWLELVAEDNRVHGI